MIKCLFFMHSALKKVFVLQKQNLTFIYISFFLTSLHTAPYWQRKNWCFKDVCTRRYTTEYSKIHVWQNMFSSSVTHQHHTTPGIILKSVILPDWHTNTLNFNVSVWECSQLESIPYCVWVIKRWNPSCKMFFNVFLNVFLLCL